MESQPYLLHVVPVGNDAVLDGVLQGEDTSLALGLVSDVGVLLSHTNHHTLVTGAAHDGREDSTGSIVSGETGLAHTGSVVDNQRSNFVFCHCDWDCSNGRTQRERITTSVCLKLPAPTGGGLKRQPSIPSRIRHAQLQVLRFLPNKAIVRTFSYLIGRSLVTGQQRCRGTLTNQIAVQLQDERRPLFWCF